MRSTRESDFSTGKPIAPNFFAREDLALALDQEQSRRINDIGRKLGQGKSLKPGQLQHFWQHQDKIDTAIGDAVAKMMADRTSLAEAKRIAGRLPKALDRMLADYRKSEAAVIKSATGARKQARTAQVDAEAIERRAALEVYLEQHPHLADREFICRKVFEYADDPGSDDLSTTPTGYHYEVEPVADPDEAELEPAPKANGHLNGHANGHDAAPAKKRGTDFDVDPPEDTETSDRQILNGSREASTWTPPHDFWIGEARERIRPGMLPELIANVSEEYAARMGLDRDTLATSMLTMVSAVIPTNIKVCDSHEADNTFRQSIRIWQATVGVAGSGKSPIMEALEQPFDAIDKKHADAFKREMAVYSKLPKEERLTVDTPIKRRLILPDASTESAQKVFADNEAAGDDGALLGKFDELINFFAARSRYSNRSGGGEQAARGFWLSSYDSKRFTLTRLNRPDIDCTPSISIIGNLQPKVLTQLMEDAGQNDGLVQRFVPQMMPETSPPKIESDEPAKYPMSLYWDLVRDLHENCPLRATGAELHFSQKAAIVKRKMFDWVTDQVEYYRPIDDALASHINKFRGMFLRYCGLFHMIEHYRDTHPQLISADTALAVYRFLTSVRLSHAVAFYNQIRQNEETGDLKGIAEYILAKRVETVRARDIQQGAARFRRISTRDINATVGNLVSLGWLHHIVGKRVDSFNWRINPDVHSLFADRAGQIRVRLAERQRIAEANFAAAKDGQSGNDET